MDDRDILDQRLKTLEALLTAKGTLAGGPAELGRQIQLRWSQESRLIQRLLAETPGRNVADTMALWRTRTARFIESSKAGVDGWVDGHGQRWDAQEVLGLLDELNDRVAAWSVVPDAAAKGSGEQQSSAIAGELGPGDKTC